jgi:hypothetical protein
VDPALIQASLTGDDRRVGERRDPEALAHRRRVLIAGWRSLPTRSRGLTAARPLGLHISSPTDAGATHPAIQGFVYPSGTAG